MGEKQACWSVTPPARPPGAGMPPAAAQQLFSVPLRMSLTAPNQLWGWGWGGAGQRKEWMGALGEQALPHPLIINQIEPIVKDLPQRKLQAQPTSSASSAKHSGKRQLQPVLDSPREQGGMHNRTFLLGQCSGTDPDPDQDGPRKQNPQTDRTSYHC